MTSKTFPTAPRRRVLLAQIGAAAALACAVALPVQAQSAAFPNKPVKMVVGYAAGALLT